MCIRDRTKRARRRLFHCILSLHYTENQSNCIPWPVIVTMTLCSLCLFDFSVTVVIMLSFQSTRVVYIVFTQTHTNLMESRLCVNCSNFSNLQIKYKNKGWKYNYIYTCTTEMQVMWITLLLDAYSILCNKRGNFKTSIWMTYFVVSEELPFFGRAVLHCISLIACESRL